VNPLDFSLLADENVHPEVVRFLADRGHDIQSVAGQGLVGQSDAGVMRLAHAAGRVVLTHDSDFGTLAIAQGEPFTGIIYLRPGHIRPGFTVETLETIAVQALDARAPFILAARSERTVRIRVRQL